MKLKRYLTGVAILAAFLTSCTEEDETTKNIIVEGNINTTTTWEASENYLIKGDVYIDNTTLTIQPGTTIRFEAGASLTIGYYGSATLIANGTAEKPIIFTSVLDNPTAGSWDGIYLYGYNSPNTSFKYCQIKYAGTNDNAALNINGTSCTFSNNTIQYAKKLGIRCFDSDSYFVEMNSNTISECGGHALRIGASNIHKIGTANTFTCTDGLGISVWEDKDVTGTISWKKQTVPYYIEGEVDVDATLTIEAGSIFKFDADGSLYFGYYGNNTLTANGTEANKIIFTSSAASPAAGAWKGIYFYGYNQQNTSMTYCEIAYAGKSNAQALFLTGTKLTFSNNYIHHSNETAIKVDYDASFVAMDNNKIDNCGKHAIVMYAKYFHTIGTGNNITAASDMGIFLEGGNVIANGTWRKQTVPVIINSEVDIDAVLTIEAGSTFKFGGDGSLWFGYYSNTQLIANGTSVNPIVFTAWATSPTAGAWKGIVFDSNSSPNTVMDYCEIRYAGKGGNSDDAAIRVDGVNGLTIKNSKLMHSNGWGIYLNNSTLSGTSNGNTFTSCASGNTGNN